MISIIVPVLNEETVLPGFLKQFDMLDDDFEVVICDGGSTDRTIGVIRDAGIPNLKIVPATRGRARQMNAGAKSAGGEIYLFLHADTYLPGGALRAIMNSMSDEAVAGGRFKVRLDNPAFLYRAVGAMITIRDGLFGGFTGDQAIFMRASAFESLGGFADIELCEDLDIARRMKAAGTTVRLPLYVTTGARRWEKGGPVKTILLMWFIRILFYAGASPHKLARFYADVR